MKKPLDLFISYAIEDKNEIAKPLIAKLKQAGLKVWNAETALSLGDSIIDGINKGLAQSSFGLVILSPTYLQKAWTKQELNAMFSWEKIKNDKHILPIWHQIDHTYLMESCPLLVDKWGISSDQPLDVLVDQIKKVLLQAPDYKKFLVNPPISQDTSTIKNTTYHQRNHTKVEKGDNFNIQAETVNFNRSKSE